MQYNGNGLETGSGPRAKVVAELSAQPVGSSAISVGIAELQAMVGAALLTSMSVASCVSVCILDPEAHVSGMVQVMLPHSLPDERTDKPGAFADIGVPELVKNMIQLGADKNRMVAAVVGGATMRSSIPELELGRRTSDAVVHQLDRLGINCVAQELGGCTSRTVTMASDTGQVVINTVRGSDVLCSLRGMVGA